MVKYGIDGEKDVEFVKGLLDCGRFPSVGRIKAVAKATGYSPASVSRFLSGKQSIPAEFVLRLQLTVSEDVCKQHEELVLKDTSLMPSNISRYAAFWASHHSNDNQANSSKFIEDLTNHPVEFQIFMSSGGIKAEIWEIIKALQDDEALELLKYMRSQEFQNLIKPA